ncbi:MAG: Rrf2 family transcriptional regulator [Bacillota bacterium]
MITSRTVPQLMAILTRKGWVNSARGAGGGVRLAIDPKNVTVQDVIGVSGDPLLVKGCASPTDDCPQKPTCPLHPLWARAQASLDAAMRGATLADLLKSSI